MVIVNRFPKMAAIQRARAQALGYDEEMSKMIGIAQAKKYAIFKARAYAMPRRRRGGRGRGRGQGDWDIPQDRPWKVDPVFKLYVHKENGLPIVAGEIPTPEDYDRALAKFPEEVRDAIEAWAETIVDHTPIEDLVDESRFFNRVWKVVRDQDPVALMRKAA